MAKIRLFAHSSIQKKKTNDPATSAPLQYPWLFDVFATCLISMSFSHRSRFPLVHWTGRERHCGGVAMSGDKSWFVEQHCECCDVGDATATYHRRRRRVRRAPYSARTTSLIRTTKMLRSWKTCVTRNSSSSERGPARLLEKLLIGLLVICT